MGVLGIHGGSQSLGADVMEEFDEPEDSLLIFARAYPTAQSAVGLSWITPLSAAGE